MTPKKKGHRSKFSLNCWNICIFLYGLFNLCSLCMILGEELFPEWELPFANRRWQFGEGVEGTAAAYCGIMVAMWVAGITILIFILGKTQDVIYGIEFKNIIRWKTSLGVIFFAGVCYALLFPAGLYVCIQCDIRNSVRICLLTYGWMIGTGIFIAYYSRRTNIYKVIRSVSQKFVIRNCITSKLFEEDVIKPVNEIPLMNMIRNMVFDNREETQIIKECIYDICNILERQKNIQLYYPMLMPIISAVFENSGFLTRYELGRTVDFCADLLEENWNPDINIWIRAGIILPMVERTEQREGKKNFVMILKRFPWVERRELILISLLYVDYLRSCGDDSKHRFEVLMQMDPISVIREYEMTEDKKKRLYMVWISWHLLNNQDTFQVFLFEHFINGCIQWNEEERVLQSYVLGRLELEEIKDDKSRNINIV